MPTDDVQTCEPTLDNQTEAACNSHQLDVTPPNPVAMYRTIAALLAVADLPARFAGKQTHATNTNTGNLCDESVDEIDSYHHYFKQINIHFQKPAMENEQVEAAGLHTDHEYGLNDNLDWRASNDICSADIESSSLCSSDRTNQPPQDPYQHTELNNDCSINNNSIKHRARNNNNVEQKAVGREVESVIVQPRRKAPNTLNLILSNTTSATGPTSPTMKKRKISNLKRTYKQMHSSKYGRASLNGITEECEYDSENGKFNCKIGADPLTSDTSSGSYEFSDETATIQTNSASSNEDRSLNDLNLTPKHRIETNGSTECFNIDSNEKMVTKRIEFFENITNKQESKPKLPERTLSSFICLTTFILTLVYLLFFPLPK